MFLLSSCFTVIPLSYFFWQSTNMKNHLKIVDPHETAANYFYAVADFMRLALLQDDQDLINAANQAVRLGAFLEQELSPRPVKRI